MEKLIIWMPFQKSQDDSIATSSVSSRSQGVTQGKMQLVYIVKKTHTAFIDCYVK